MPPVIGTVDREPVVILVPGRTAVARMAGMTSVTRHVRTAERLGLEPIVVFHPSLRTLGAEVSSELPDQVRCLSSAELANGAIECDPVLVVTADWYVSFRAFADFCRTTHGVAAARFEDRGRVVAPVARVPLAQLRRVAERMRGAPSGALLSEAAGDEAAIFPIGVKSRHRLSDNFAVERAEAKLFSALERPGQAWFVQVMGRYLSFGLTPRLARVGLRPLPVSLLKLAMGIVAASLLAGKGFLGLLAGALLLCLTRAFDGAASEIARARILNRTTVERIDMIGDVAVFILAVLALASRPELGPPAGRLAAVTVIGILASGALAYVLVLQDRWHGLDRKGYIPMPANDFASRFTNRGGAAYGLLFAVLIGRLDLFLWATAIGSHLFYVVLLRTYARRAA